MAVNASVVSPAGRGLVCWPLLRLARRGENRLNSPTAAAFFSLSCTGVCAMASLSNDPGGRRRILFVSPDGDRKAIRLGKMSKSDATTIRVRVEQLVTAKIVGSMSRDLSSWVELLQPWLREKLERVELLEPIEAVEPEPMTSLKEFLKDFVERNGRTKKPATRVVWGQVTSLLLEYLPAG